MISIFENKTQEELLLNPLRTCKITANTSYILDKNLNYYLKSQYSDRTTHEGRIKSFSIIPISYCELRDLLEKRTSDLQGVLVSFRMVESHNFDTFSSQREIETYRHN